MPGPPGLGLASRLLKPLIQNLTRKAATASRGGKQQSPYEIVRDLGRSVIDSTFGAPKRAPIFERVPINNGYGGKFGNRINQLRNGGARDYSSASSRSPPLHQSTTFNESRLRPNFHSYTLRGPSQVSHIGLRPSPARTFATYGTTKIGHELQRNVPIGLRALADRLKHADEKAMKKRGDLRMKRTGEESRVVMKSLGKWEKEHGGNKFGIVQKSADAKADKQTRKSRQFTKYFPLAGEAVFVESPVQRTIESVSELVSAHAEAGPSQPRHRSPAQEPSSLLRHDPSSTTYLLLPLSPSLSHILTLPSSPSTSTIDQSYIPQAELPAIISTALPIHLAYDDHTRKRLIPLLIRLSGKGCFDPERLGGTHTEAWLAGAENKAGKQTISIEVVYGPVVLADGSIDANAQEPEALRLTFSGYTELGVRDLIGGDHTQGREWWYIYPIKREGHTSLAGSDSVTTPISSTSSAMGSYSVSDTDSLFDSSSLMDVTSGTITRTSSFGDLHSLWGTLSPREHVQPEFERVEGWEDSTWRMPTVNNDVTGGGSVRLADVEEMERVEEQVWARA